MNFFSAFGLGGKSAAPKPAGMRTMLPAVNSFVDVAVGKSPQRESVPVNDVGPSNFVIRCPRGLAAGMPADFLYANAAGRFRFQATCTHVDGTNAHFDHPAAIKTLESYSNRSAARVSKIIPVEWRYAPDGQGYGEYMTGSLMDLSRGGASLVVDRTLKVSTQVEVRFTLDAADTTFVELCQVVRAAKIEVSAKNAVGIRFLKMDPADEKTLITYLHELQMARRDRGFV